MSEPLVPVRITVQWVSKQRNRFDGTLRGESREWLARLTVGEHLELTEKLQQMLRDKVILTFSVESVEVLDMKAALTVVEWVRSMSGGR